MEKYDSYKDSGVEWIGDIPTTWKILPGLRVVSERREKNKGLVRNTVLSLSYGNIRVKQEDELTGLVPESFETYQFVEVGDIIFRPTDLQNDKTSLRSGISKYQGIITSAYLNLAVGTGMNNKFYDYFLRVIDNNKVIYGLGSGLRQNIDFRDFKRFPFIVPPELEQTAIATFLDQKTAQIDRAIVQKERLIELLRERKQIVIQQAVTRGLDPTVKMKDSGVEWIGEVPEHWEVKKLKYVATIRGGFAFSGNDFVDEGVQLIKISNTYNNKLSLERQPTFLPPSFLQSHRQWIVSKGDILMSLTGTLGKRDYGFAILLKSSEKYLLNQRVAKISTKENVNEHYLLLLLKNERYLDKLYTLPSGTKQANLSNDNVIGIEVAVPPVNEQINIIKRVNSDQNLINQSIKLHTQQIAKIKEYRTVLIDAAVTGKIKVS